MPIYQNNMQYGLQGIQPGLSVLAEGAARRAGPESRQYRANLEELTQWITPDGEISRSAPRAIRNDLETIIAEGRLYVDPTTPNSFGVLGPGEQIPQGMQPFKPGTTFYDIWGPTKQSEEGKEHYVDKTKTKKDDFQKAMEDMVTHNQPSAQNMLQFNYKPPQQAPQQAPTPIPQQQPPPMQQPTIQQLMQFRQQQMQQQTPNIGMPSFQQPQQNPFAQMLGMPQQGPIKRYENGGQVSGLDQLRELMGLDRGEVPIIAHEGEYVLNNNAVNTIGAENLDTFNNLMRQAPHYANGGTVDWDFGERKKMAETSRQRQNEVAEQGGQQKTIQRPASDALGGLNRVAHDMPTKDDEVLKEIGRQVVERMTDFGRNAPEQGYNRVAGVPGAQPEGRQHRAPTQASGRPVDRSSKDQTQGVDAISSAQPKNDYRRDRPMGGNGQPTSGVTVNRENAVRPPGGPYRRSAPKPPPTVNLPNKDEVPKREENKAAGGPTEDDTTTQQPSMDRPFYRSPNAAQNIDWGQLAQLEPGQAMSYLQQYANTQGVQTNVNLTGKDNPNRQMFADLVGHYATMTGIEDRVNQQKWRDIIGENNAEKARLEIQEMKAMSPYTSDLTKAKLDLTKAQTKNLLAQSMAAEEQVGRSLSIDPTKLISAMSTVENVKGKIVDDIKDAMQTSLQFAKSQKNSKEAWKDFYEKQVMYDMVAGTMSPYLSYEEAKGSIGKGPGKKFFGGEKYGETLTEEEYLGVQSQAMQILTKLNSFDQMLGQQQNAGNLVTLLQQLGIGQE